METQYETKYCTKFQKPCLEIIYPHKGETLYKQRQNNTKKHHLTFSTNNGADGINFIWTDDFD